MASKKNRILVLILVILFMLMLTFILTNVGKTAGEEVSHTYFAPEVAHELGGIAILLLGVSATYSILKEFSPKKTRLWLGLHCASGILASVFVSLHLANSVRGGMRPSYFVSFFALFLMIVLVIGGFAGSYMKIRVLEGYWRILHTPLAILFYLMFAIHLLQKFGIIQ